MFRKLLFLLLLACSANAMAQVAITPIKSEAKNVPDTTDYKRMGAPMPGMRLKIFKDTAKKDNLLTVITKDTSVRNRESTAYITGKTVNTKDTVVTTHKHKKKAVKEDKVTEQKAIVAKPKDYLTNADFDNGANLMVMMFNPTCSHCEDETELLEKNIFYFTKSKLILMANPMMWEYLPNFVKSFHIFDYPAITLGSDSTFISKVFLYSALPQINIYDKHRKLIKTFSGEVVMDSLKKYIE